MGKVDLLLVLVPLEEREIDDPAELETVAVDEVQFLAGAGAGGTCEGDEFLRIAGSKEGSIALAQTELNADSFSALLADVLGDRAGAFKLVAFLAPEDVAEARLALALRP